MCTVPTVFRSVTYIPRTRKHGERHAAEVRLLFTRQLDAGRGRVNINPSPQRAAVKKAFSLEVILEIMYTLLCI